MPRRIHLHPYVSKHNLQERYRHVHTSVEHSRWQFLWLLTHGLTAMAIARVTGYSTVLADGGPNSSAKQSDERRRGGTGAQHVNWKGDGENATKPKEGVGDRILLAVAWFVVPHGLSLTLMTFWSKC